MSGSHFARFAELGTTMSPDILAICLFAGLEWQLASRMCILTHHRLLAATAFQGRSSSSLSLVSQGKIRIKG